MVAAAAPPDIVVLGGGSAGWITACLLHHAWGERGATVTVVESPDIGIIGVGEGSTPQLKALFDHLGIAEAEWMPACDATYKLGIRFTGWSERPGFASYFHPFPCPVDLHSEPVFVAACGYARRGFDVAALPDRYFLAARLADEGKGPVPDASFPFAPSYGYHFDAHKLGAYLRDWAVARGVRHVPQAVVDVEIGATGAIAALVCADGARIEGGLFVDCSGFRALLIQERLGAAFLPFADNLFNDRAVVMPTPATSRFRPQTESIAMRAGWRWSIPLTRRVGNGYVYASAYLDADAAEAELRAALGEAARDAPARHLTMKVGRVADSWRGNCLATGLAQGFIEPLEATALHIVIATAFDFIRCFEQGGFTPAHRDAFNARIGARYDAIRDYIVAHYRLNQRTDTAYWRANAANPALSDNLKAMMTAWFTHGDIAAAARTLWAEPAYSSASWHCLFAGYGSFPDPVRMQSLPPGLAAPDSGHVERMLAACAGNFAALPG